MIPDSGEFGVTTVANDLDGLDGLQATPPG
jgi:hypothetical protein